MSFPSAADAPPWKKKSPPKLMTKWLDDRFLDVRRGSYHILKAAEAEEKRLKALPPPPKLKPVYVDARCYKNHKM